MPSPAASDGVLASGSSGSPVFDDEGYVVGVYSNATCGGIPACEEFSAVRVALPEMGGVLSAAEEIARSGLGVYTRNTGVFTGFTLGRTDFGVRNEQPLAVALLADGTGITAGFATSPSGERVGALVAYDVSGAIATGFQDNGRLADDIDLSSREEFVDLAIQSIGGEERILVLASVADPDEMALVRYTSGGDRDTSFGINGEIRIPVVGAAPDASTTAAGLAIDPSDGSIIVAGHSSVEMFGR